MIVPYRSIAIAKWPVGAAATLVSLALLAGQPAAQDAIPVGWDGTATVTHTFRPAVAFDAADWDGAFVDQREVRLRTKESRRADVHDGQGHLTGQIVWLEDEGTTWTGSVADTESHLGGSIRFLSTGGGRGTAMVYGMIYHSMATPDPLASALADGTYCVQATLSPALPYTLTLREEGRPDEVEDYTSLSQLLVGNCSLIGRIARLGGNLTVDRIAAAVAAPLAPDETFLVEGRRQLLNGRMTGSSDREIEAGNRVAVTWSARRRLRLTGTMTASDPAWRPRLPESTPPFTAAIDDTLGIAGKFRFTLYDVSREPGYALNAGGDGTGLDLRFEDDQPVAFGERVQTADGWTIETLDAHRAAAVMVTAFDYGAWGKLRAEINVDGEWYDCLAPDGRAYVTVPLDTNENRIWDTWEHNTGVWDAAASADGDDLPEGASRGDGFSNFEEYRGFMVGTDWVSTDPLRKDLFVYDSTGNGVGYFGQTGVVTYLVNEDQFDNERVVNHNRGYASRGPQRGLRVISETLGTGNLGEVRPRVGPPNVVEVVVINTEELALMEDVALPSTIAHELGHAVGIDHHGDWDYGSCNGGDDGIIALWRGAHAGDRFCPMSYSSATYYRGWDGKCYDYEWPAIFGTRFCLNRSGTDINAGAREMVEGHPMPVSGDGTHGDCLHALRLK